MTMKKELSVFFLIFLCVLFVGTIQSGFIRDVWDGFSNYGGGIKGLVLAVIDTQTIEDHLNTDVFLHDNWVDLFGGALRVTGVCSLHEEDNKHIVRLKNDALTFVWEQDMISAQQEESVRSLFRTAQAAGSDCLYVSIPHKTCPQQTEYCARGAVNRTEVADRKFMDVFGCIGYRILDLHEHMHAEGLRHTELYYRTDHHWTGSTALWAAGVIAKEIGLSAEDIQPDRFDSDSYPRSFLGSEGKHFGRLYCGLDDFIIPTPCFQTNLTLTNDNASNSRTGTFFDVLIDRKSLAYDPFHATMYAAFLGGDKGWTSIQNALLPQGKRILIVKDSFTNSMAPYLALICGQLDLIDPRHYEGPILRCAAEGNYDVIIVATKHLEGAWTN